MTRADLNAGSRVILISENLARELWGTAPAAIGRHIPHPPSSTGPPSAALRV